MTLRWQFGKKCRWQWTFVLCFWKRHVTLWIWSWPSNEICQTYTLSPAQQIRPGWRRTNDTTKQDNIVSHSVCSDAVVMSLEQMYSQKSKGPCFMGLWICLFLEHLLYASWNLHGVGVHKGWHKPRFKVPKRPIITYNFVACWPDNAGMAWDINFIGHAQWVGTTWFWIINIITKQHVVTLVIIFSGQEGI